MDPRTSTVAPLLFLSGLCGLLFQTAWLRELRLVFGASTAASAAVLAIFMGGLGLGGALLGRRADRHGRPLRLYGDLELLTALAAALTPALLWLAGRLYVALGGTVALGLVGGTALRLLLSALVLGVPAVLMGGTLPAAARALTAAPDETRRGVAVLYGLNAMGAVTGALLATFLLLERLGTRGTLWTGAALGVGLGLVARRMGARAAVEPARDEGETAHDGATRVAPPARFLLGAAAVTGFAFFLMELVWYRMLAPLLGGSTYTFGLILAMALLGIGLGGLGYAWLARGRVVTLRHFALSCTLMAVFVAAPLALGDRLAVGTLLLRSIPVLGFLGRVVQWTMLTALVVVPASLVAGAQFPLLLALLTGEGAGGRAGLGQRVGLAYACNTAGAIAGSLLGGFGLLPLLTAPGTWRLVVFLLLLLGLLAALLYNRLQTTAPGPRWRPLAAPLTLALGAALLGVLPGPTTLWRHGGIGAGRAGLIGTTENTLHDFAQSRRRIFAWEAEGRESSVAMTHDNGISFVINGKADGNVWADAPTQVMGGLLGALLHSGGPPRRALVIGLGTGSTAGWLAAVPSMERVDVVELEPAVREVARACAAVNHDALDNQRVRVLLGDAREVLLTSRERYDVIFSEPSNPYRAGVSSLFTDEFYRAALARLSPGGVFVQWLQAYEVDAQTVHSVYATLAGVFPSVETWQPVYGDLFLLGSPQPLSYDVEVLRARIAQAPYKDALARVLRTTDLEGLLARFVARDSLSRAIARIPGTPRSTDDRTAIEFGFARTVGQKGLFEALDLWQVARARKEDRPETTHGEIDWPHVEDQRLSMLAASGVAPAALPGADAELRARAEAEAAYVEGRLPDALRGWSRLRRQEPADLLELVLMAEILADAGSEAALPFVARLQTFQPVEADAVLARLLFRKGQISQAAVTLVSAFERYRVDPWPLPGVMKRALDLSVQVAARDASAGALLFETLRTPFAVFMLQRDRSNTVLELAGHLDLKTHCAQGLEGLEPHVPWQASVLAYRARCYQEINDPRAAAARRDLERFAEAEPMPFGAGLVL